MWDFVASSDRAIAFALYSSLVAGVMTMMLFIWVVILRVRLLAQERRRKAFIERWRPLLTRIALAPDAAVGDDEGQPLPELPTASLMYFLNEWNVLHDILRGSAGLRLNALARRMEIDKAAWRLLNHGRLSDQLIAIATLGHLGETGAWDRLLELLHSEHTLISLMS
ncbi:MAG: hypothetical protein PVG91_05850, partial [Gammaproteobacteria bacterium]